MKSLTPTYEFFALVVGQLIMTKTLGEIEFSDAVQAGSIFVFIIAVLLVSEPAITAIVAVLAIFGIIPGRYRLVGFVIFIGAFILNSLIGNAVVASFAALNPDLPRVFVSALLAGVIEPVTTKFLPAATIIWYYKDRSQETIERIREQPWVWGAVLGWTFGIFEMLLKIPSKSTAYANVNAITLSTFVPSLLHFLTGLLVAGAVFRWWQIDGDFSRRIKLWTGVKFGLLLILAMVIHILWNVIGVGYIQKTFEFLGV